MAQKATGNTDQPGRGVAPAATHDRLFALVRLLARQAAKEVVAATAESKENPDA
ncbi:hypothetical protein [Minwuia sp.]|uniref:hypothetical protein n=1 Tax=Minwuia sp. TaxID=2493630 RepID=UPI003A8FEA1D